MWQLQARRGWDAVKTDTRTVTQLFDQAVRYVVPLYQRPYVWREKDQWQPLLDDILTLIEHRENGGSDVYSHFLGAIVLEQEIQPPGEIPLFTVIDGQQRLTTLQIILAAASNLARRSRCGERGRDRPRPAAQRPKKASGTALQGVADEREPYAFRRGSPTEVRRPTAVTIRTIASTRRTTFFAATE